MINHKQLKKYVLTPVLVHLRCYSEDAMALMMMTALVESNQGQYLHQLGSGPACGIFQMEPATHEDIWNNFLAYRPELTERIRYWELEGAFDDDNSQEMCGNLYYASAMARMQYYRHDEELPSRKNVWDMARYYKKYFNSTQGASTIKGTVELYNRYDKANRENNIV